LPDRSLDHCRTHQLMTLGTGLRSHCIWVHSRRFSWLHYRASYVGTEIRAHITRRVQTRSFDIIESET
jgi:hypothetical protein